MAKITKILAREILNSKGEPTVEAKVILDDGYYGISSTPTGASISKFEASELRDSKNSRFAGLGVLGAVSNISQIIAPKLTGFEATNQEKIDQILQELDSTPDKAKLGVNAILPVSQAVLVAASASAKTPLWKYLGQKFFGGVKPQIPTPVFNVINGGIHGAGNLDFQEFLVVPVSTKPFPESLQLGVEVYFSLKKILAEKHHIYSLGDEGGFAPSLYSNAEAFEVLTEAVMSTQYKLTHDLFFGLDAAASYLLQNSSYIIKDRANPLNSDQLIDYYKDLIKRFHLLILEDPLTEDDFDSWKVITSQLGDQLIIVGDDLIATNPKRLETAISENLANAVIVKPNQIGTITETVRVILQAKAAGWKIVISHRSGETNDTFLADLSVAASADYAKFGAPARGERVAKYNRLSEIYLSLTNKL